MEWTVCRWVWRRGNCGDRRGLCHRRRDIRTLTVGLATRCYARVLCRFGSMQMQMVIAGILCTIDDGSCCPAMPLNTMRPSTHARCNFNNLRSIKATAGINRTRNHTHMHQRSYPIHTHKILRFNQMHRNDAGLGTKAQKVHL